MQRPSVKSLDAVWDIWIKTKNVGFLDKQKKDKQEKTNCSLCGFFWYFTPFDVSCYASGCTIY